MTTEERLLDVVKTEPDDRCSAEGSASGHMGNLFLAVFFGHQVLIFGVKTLGLTFTGCT